MIITPAEPIDLDSLRMRHEFLTAPDLRLSAEAAASRLNVSQPHAVLILESLVCEGFLMRLSGGSYARRLHADDSPMKTLA